MVCAYRRSEFSISVGKPCLFFIVGSSRSPDPFLSLHRNGSAFLRFENSGRGGRIARHSEIIGYRFICRRSGRNEPDVRCARHDVL